MINVSEPAGIIHRGGALAPLCGPSREMDVSGRRARLPPLGEKIDFCTFERRRRCGLGDFISVDGGDSTDT